MSDTPRNQDDSRDPDASGTPSGDPGAFRDPTAPSWSEPDAGAPGTSGAPDPGRGPAAEESDSGVTWSDTQALSPEGTRQLPLEPPAGGNPPPPPGFGQPGQPEQTEQTEQAGPVEQPGSASRAGGQAEGGPGQGYPPSPYAQQGPYGQSPYAQAPPQQPYPYGQGQPAYGYGQAPSPYARRQSTNGSALVLLIVAGLSTLVGCLFAIPAVIFGILAMVKQNEDPAESAKFTRWGWIAYAVAVGLVVILAIGAIALFATSASTTY